MAKLPKARLLCSTGAFIGRPNGRDWRLIPPYAKKLHADGLELLFYPEWVPERIRMARELRLSGLRFPVLHAEKGVGSLFSQEGMAGRALLLFQRNCEAAREIGAETVVLHLWDGPSSDRAIENHLRHAARLNAIASEHGLVLAVENAICACSDPLTHFRELRDIRPPVHFLYDTKMAAFHGQVMALFEPQWDWIFTEKRLRHLHINDYPGLPGDWGTMLSLHRGFGTHIGKGNIDFAAFFGALRRKGYDGRFTVESSSFEENGQIRLDLLNDSLDAVRALIGPDALPSPGAQGEMPRAF